MKSILILIAICLTQFTYGQELQTVYSIVKERQDAAWYKTQQGLWKAEVEKDRKNANAWYNYYNATRQLKNTMPWEDEQRNELHSLCDQIVADAYKEIPNTFEGNHLMWWNKGFDNGELKYLMKAYEISPNDVRIFGDLMIHYETTRNIPEMRKVCQKMFEANELPDAILNWAYNALSELEPNAVVFTGGDNDTFAMWIVQYAKNFRTDVKIVNTYLVALEDYRKKITEELGMESIDFSPEEGGREKMLTAFLKNDRGIPMHVAISAIREFEDYQEKEHLYLTGLTYLYSQESIDNVSLIKRNYEKRYLIDYLKERFSTSISDGVADRFEPLYLPSMLKLYKHYAKSEDLYKMNQLEKLIVSISEKSGQQGEVFEVIEELSKKSSSLQFSTMLLDLKSLEKNMTELSEGILISKTEVTNSEYSVFINNVLRSRQVDLYKEVIYDSTQWVKMDKGEDQTPMQNLYHWHSAYVDYPAVNISYDAAVVYCNWLTDQYNKQRKRNYTKVKFRLPSEKEWEMAASSNSNGKKYGTLKDQLTNEKGCYLVNLAPDNASKSADGGFYTVKVDSYFPNDLGIYNMIGNVAEMIDTKGISKGGSWNSSPKNSTIQSKEKYTAPSPSIGFRIIMEVIEK